MNNIQQFLEEEKEKVRNAYFYKADDFDVALKDHDTRLINFVLSEVEKEVEMLPTNYFLQAIPYVKETDISTIINNLKVK